MLFLTIVHLVYLTEANGANRVQQFSFFTFLRLADEDEARSAAVQMLSNEDEELILRDPRHPRWQEARERFEARFGMSDAF